MKARVESCPIARTLLVLLLCGRLAGVCWSQGPPGGLDFLREGIAAYEAGQWQGCVDALEKAVAQGFGNPLYRLDALVFLGRAQAQLGHEERALAYFKEVLKLQPDYRLDAADLAGLELFGRLLGGDEKDHEQMAKGGGFPTGKVVAGAGGVGVIAAILLLLSGGGGGSEPAPDRGSIEGVVVLP